MNLRDEIADDTCQLKRCPFCGGTAEVDQCDDETSSNWNGYYVECLKCHASTAVVFGEWQAVLYELWNRRVQP